MRRPVRRRARRLAGLVGTAFASYYGPAVLERFLPPTWRRRFQQRFGNPGGKLMSILPGWAIVETTGRRSGQARQVPVGGRVIDDDFWFVAADPDRAGYVRNIEADPGVRVRARGRWRTGTAQPVPDDDARRRMYRLNPINGLYLAIAGRRHRTIRVLLDP